MLRQTEVPGHPLDSVNPSLPTVRFPGLKYVTTSTYIRREALCNLRGLKEVFVVSLNFIL